mgnify:CR=1 FL=1
MSSNTITEVKSALVSALGSIQTSTGYKSNLPASKIQSGYAKNIIDSTLDDNYPKCCVMYDLGRSDRETSGFLSKTLNFIIIFIAKRTKAVDLDAAVQCENFIDDLDRLVKLNETLGGSVSTCSISEWVTDDGVRSPEGIVLAYLTTEREVH